MPQLTEQQERALRTARVLLDLGHPRDEVLANPAIPEDLRAWVAEEVGDEGNRTYEKKNIFGQTHREDDNGNRTYIGEDALGNECEEDE